MISTWLRKPAVWPLLLLTLAAGHTFATAYLRPAEGVAQDSISYLAVARLIAAGTGLRELPVDSAIWPLGYPLLTALVMQLSGLEGFWASKLANLIMLAFYFAFLARRFKNAGWVYALGMFTASQTALQQASLSETSFIVSLCLFAFLLASYCDEGKARYLAAASLCAVLAFMFRYAGVVLLVPFGLLGLWRLKAGNAKAFLQLLVAGLAAALAEGVYLFWNQMRFGHYAGMQRPASAQGLGELLGDLAQGLLFELNPLRQGYAPQSLTQAALWWLTFIATVAGAWWLWRSWRRAKQTEEAKSALAGICLLTGFSYLLFIVTLRWKVGIDALSYRFLAPWTALMLVALAAFLAARSAAFATLGRLLLAMALLAAGVNASWRLYQAQALNIDSFLDAREKARTLPAQATLLYGDVIMQYLRPDISQPFRPDLSQDAALDVLAEKSCRTHPGGVYLEYRPYMDKWALAPSLRQKLGEGGEERLIGISDCAGKERQP